MTSEALIAALAAPFVGSFLGLVIDRLPLGRPIIVGRSVCDHCGRQLALKDLLPLLSYLMLRGHCRSCGQRLRAFFPLIELAALTVVIVTAAALSGWLFWVSIVLGWCLLVLAVIDQHHLILPDSLTLPLIPFGLVVAYVIDPGLIDDHVIGCVVGFLAFAGIAWLYKKLRDQDGLGLGDAKLLSGAGAWLGWASLPSVVLIAAFTALAVTLFRQGVGGERSAGGQIAFGPHLALAFWVTWLLGPITWG